MRTPSPRDIRTTDTLPKVRKTIGDYLELQATARMWLDIITVTESVVAAYALHGTTHTSIC